MGFSIDKKKQVGNAKKFSATDKERPNHDELHRPPTEEKSKTVSGMALRVSFCNLFFAAPVCDFAYCLVYF